MAIYFITAREVGRVKIGFSEAPRSRFVKMRTDSPVPLNLERICDGDVTRERELHERFAEARLSGEWFALTPEIVLFMDTLPAAPAMREPRPPSINQLLIAATGCTKTYASELLSGRRPIPLPVCVSFHNHTGKCIGPLEGATDHEVAVLKKFIAPWSSQMGRAA